jgi:hypothetical protein
MHHSSSGLVSLVNFDFETQQPREKIIDQIFEIAVSLIAPHEKDSFNAKISVGKRLEDGTLPTKS